jgi:hypothetical protein
MKPGTVISISMLVCLGWLTAAAAQDAPSPKHQKLDNMEKSIPEDPMARFYRLGDLAEAAYAAGEMDKAQSYADELISAAPKYPKDWNYGNAVFTGNTVAGLVALKRDNNVSQADGYLLASARTPGSPQLNSFGPSMLLAKRLLAACERDSVLDFLRECGSFWKMGQDKLDSWSDAIKNGQTPDFGPNTRY